MIINALMTHFMYMYVWGVSLVPQHPPPPTPHPHTHTLTNEPMKKTYESREKKKNEEREKIKQVKS